MIIKKLKEILKEELKGYRKNKSIIEGKIDPSHNEQLSGEDLFEYVQNEEGETVLSWVLDEIESLETTGREL